MPSLRARLRDLNAWLRPALPEVPPAPSRQWWDVAAKVRDNEARKRAEQARRRVEETRRNRLGLVFLGVLGVISAVGITIGAVTEDDSGTGPASSAQAAALASVSPRGAVPAQSGAALAVPAEVGVESAVPAPTDAVSATPATKQATRPVTKQATKRPATKRPTAKATTRPPATQDDDEAGLDPQFRTCKAANAAGYGPYFKGVDPEYAWYRDRDKDGIVCE
jgi:cytoskeletal protein RodZ